MQQAHLCKAQVDWRLGVSGILFDAAVLADGLAEGLSMDRIRCMPQSLSPSASWSPSVNSTLVDLGLDLDLDLENPEASERRAGLARWWLEDNLTLSSPTKPTRLQPSLQHLCL